MTKLDQAIEAISALPEQRQEDLAELIVEIAAAWSTPCADDVLSDEQLVELDRRLAEDFQAGDMRRIDEMLARLP